MPRDESRLHAPSRIFRQHNTTDLYMDEPEMENIRVSFSKNRVMKRLLDQEKLVGIGSYFSDFITGLDFPVYLKDAQTGKFILSNAHHVYLRKNIDALQSPDDLIGLTADDLQETQGFVPARVYKVANELKSALRVDAKNVCHGFMEMMKNLDNNVLKNSICRISGPYASILDSGYIYMRRTIKQPILNLDKRKIIAVLAYDCPFYHSLFDLFQLYQEYYSDRLSVVLFLDYLNMGHCFYKPPTVKEMQVLLMLHQQPNRKKAAQLLNISYNTLIFYLQRVKEEVLIRPNLNEVLDQLRKITLSTAGRSKSHVSG